MTTAGAATAEGSPRADDARTATATTPARTRLAGRGTVRVDMAPFLGTRGRIRCADEAERRGAVPHRSGRTRRWCVACSPCYTGVSRAVARTGPEGVQAGSGTPIGLPVAQSPAATTAR